MTGRNGSIDFAAINDAALSRLPQLLFDWFPEGRRSGNHFLIGNLKGDAGESLSVNLGEGVWKDFATGESGADPISLYAARFELSQSDAARALVKELGLTQNTKRHSKLGTRPASRTSWRPVLPVPRNTPDPPQLRDATGFWPYRDQQGHLLGYAIRFDRGRKKQILPLTYCVNGKGTHAWRYQAPPKPRPLYGLDRLVRATDSPVLVVEGEKTADAAQQLLTDWAVLTWPGGCEAVKHADWGPLKGRHIYIWPDNDEPGRHAAFTVADELRAAGVKSMSLIGPPADVKSGWDLADALEDGWTTERVRSHIGTNAEDLSQKTGTGPGSGDNRSHPAQPFRVLGHNQMQFFFYGKRAHQVISTNAISLMSRGTLFSIAPRSYWMSAFPGGRDFDINAAVDALISSCHEAGVHDPNRLRGRGAWRDGDHIVLHLGDGLIVDGRSCALEDFESDYIYVARAPLRANPNTPLNDTETEAFLELCLKLQWEKPTAGWLLAGWCAIAPLCGVLPWRPHIWITGGAGTGKTWVLDHIIRPAVGALGLFVQSKTTEAGLRQRIESDARPVIFDEAEAEDPRARKRLQDVIELARASSSEQGSDIVKGTASGHARFYKTRGCFAFSSINVAVSRAADETRITVLSLLSSDNRSADLRAANEEHFRSLRAMQKQVITADFADRMLVRALHMAPTILKNANILSEIAAERFAGRRLADQIGVLLAGVAALQSSDLLSRDRAAALIDSLDWNDYLPRSDEGDERKLLDQLLQQSMHLPPSSSGAWTYRSIGELVAIAYGHKDDSVPQDDAVDNLKRSGFKVDIEVRLLMISNTHRFIADALRETPWAKNWSRMLNRLPGATTSKNPVRFTAGDKSRAVAVPLSLFLDDSDCPPG